MYRLGINANYRVSNIESKESILEYKRLRFLCPSQHHCFFHVSFQSAICIVSKMQIFYKMLISYDDVRMNHVNIYYYNKKLIRSAIIAKLTDTDHQIKLDAERQVWSSDPRLSTRCDPALSLIHIWRCRRYAVCRSRWSPYH